MSSNQCASPSCTKAIIAKDEKSMIAKICHIEAASSDGPRFNPDMSDDQRRHFDNLLILCDECHTIIDNPENAPQYTVDLLRNWKSQHENKLLCNVLSQQPTLLNLVITRLAEAEIDNEDGANDSAEFAFQIKDKLDYNSIKRNRPLIEDFKIFNGKLNSIYQVLEQESAFKIESLFRNIKRVYLKIKGNYIVNHENPIHDVKMHADDIFEDVEDALLKLAQEGDKNIPDDVSFGVSVVMVDAFMRCKILEEPKQ